MKLSIYLNRYVFVIRSLMKSSMCVCVGGGGGGGAFWIDKNAKFLHADNEDTDQNTRMSSLGANHINYVS